MDGLVWWGVGTGVTSFLVLTLLYITAVLERKKGNLQNILNTFDAEEGSIGKHKNRIIIPQLKPMPSPPRLPILGHLHLLNGSVTIYASQM